MIFHKCCHTNIPQHCKKAWLNPSEVFVVLQNIILDKTLLSNLKHLTNFSHKGSLEVYQSSYNKWLPKSTRFSCQEIIACSQLAATDFNLCSELTQAETKSGVKHFNVTYSKKQLTICQQNPLQKRKIEQFLKTWYRA